MVHSIPGSPYGRAVFAVLEEKGAAYRLAPVAPGQFRGPEHLARHPFGKVPVLEHDGYRLYETQAILRYLDRVLPHPCLTPDEPKIAGRMDQLMNVNDWYLFHGISTVIAFQRVVGPRVLGSTPDEAAIADVMPRARGVFAQLARELGERACFTGDAVTLADILLACHLDMLRATPEWEVLVAGHPRLAAWMTRMNERPSMLATTWERVAALAAAA